MTPRNVAAALAMVTAAGSTGSHLAPSSPAIPGATPDQMPPRTVCGLPTGRQILGRPVWEVECSACLIASTAYWQMPSWA